MSQPALGFEIRRTLVLAGPLIIGQVTNFGMNFVDTVMAGRIGTVDLGAIAVGSSIWAAGFLFVLGVLLAVSATVSQLDGAGRQAQAGEFTRQALWLALALAVLLFVVSRSAGWLMNWLGVEPAVAELAAAYLRAISWGAPALCLMMTLRFFSEGVGYTRPTMYVGFLGIALNIPLNYGLMFGNFGMPALGAVGAGWATAIVFWIQFLALAGWIAWRPRYRPFRLYERFSRPNWREIGATIRLGLPIGVMVFLEGGLFVGTALLIGTLGALPVAAHQVAMNYAGLMFMVPVGLSGAITVRVGNAIGRGDPDGARRAGLVGMGCAVTFGLFSAVIIFLFPEWIVAMYTSEPEVRALAVHLLFFAAVFQLADCLQASAAGALRGLKDTRMPMIYSVIAYWGVGMTSGWYLTFRLDWGPAGMWVGIIIGLSVASVLLGTRFARISRG
ncbi:MAG: MATE family efflux transporter [Wenzhouxiangella sp.]|nr:MAG: MATE family efflux transporter [Wenzhouxiangella sp.]